jgi:hypothetical protein
VYGSSFNGGNPINGTLTCDNGTSVGYWGNTSLGVRIGFLPSYAIANGDWLIGSFSYETL